MKRLFVLMVLAVMLIGCANVVQTPILIDAVWKGDTISMLTSSGIVEFSAPYSSASHDADVPVQITEIDGHWYIWGAGKPQNEIYRITH